ncbi:MAG TPA: hypothetical protein VMS17_19720 [Gemmataceae bacterium]|nr:hypothetical protein [Gemmataceae bacterium]
MTVRQAFYQLVAAGVVEKTENAYKAVGRVLVQMRCEGALPFEWIADNTRWMHKPATYASVEEAMRQAARTYRRALWQGQDARVEVWCEKDALAGVLAEETARLDVPLMVTRGFSSLSFLYEASAAIAAQNRPAFLYYFGDHDPSGVHIDRNIERRLRELAPEAEIRFERVAVRPEQIDEMQLPTRPTKRRDSRACGFVGGSVEVDAIPPAELRAMVRACIEQHITDRSAFEAIRAAEKRERDLLRRWACRGANNDGEDR